MVIISGIYSLTDAVSVDLICIVQEETFLQMFSI